MKKVEIFFIKYLSGHRSNFYKTLTAAKRRVKLDANNFNIHKAIIYKVSLAKAVPILEVKKNVEEIETPNYHKSYIEPLFVDIVQNIPTSKEDDLSLI